MDKQIRGLTLIEVMVTMAVAVILITVAIPNFSGMMKSNKLTTTVNELVYALNIARSEALKTGGASVCTSDDQATCTASTWDQGWIVFNDLNGDCSVDAGEALVRVVEDLPPAPFKMANVQGVNCITYGANGFLTPAGTVADFRFCDDRTGAQAGRQINVLTTGRPSTDAYANCPTV